MLPEVHAQEQELESQAATSQDHEEHHLEVRTDRDEHEVPSHHPRRQRNGGSGAFGSMPRRRRGLHEGQSSERVDGEDERINKMLAEYLEKKGQGGK